MKVGFAAIFQNKELLKCLPNESSIYSAEVIAIDLTMNIIANPKSYKFIIHSDSKSVLQALQNKNTSSSLITRLPDKIDTPSKNNSIILSWIPSNIGIHGNEKTDKAAKKKHSRQTYQIQKYQSLAHSYLTNDKNHGTIKDKTSSIVYKIPYVNDWQTTQEIEKK